MESQKPQTFAVNLEGSLHTMLPGDLPSAWPPICEMSCGCAQASQTYLPSSGVATHHVLLYFQNATINALCNWSPWRYVLALISLTIRVAKPKTRRPIRQRTKKLIEVVNQLTSNSIASRWLMQPERHAAKHCTADWSYFELT